MGRTVIAREEVHGAVAAHLAALNAGDADRIAASVTEDFFNEHLAVTGQSLRSREAYRARLPRFLADYRQIRYEVEDMLIDGDRAAVAYRMSFLWHGADPPRPVETRGLFRFRIEGGRVAHRTDYRDSLDARNQMTSPVPKETATEGGR